MKENPWLVDSIQAFGCLKCPECDFDSKEQLYFRNHALENHPLCYVLFHKKDLDDSIDQQNMELWNESLKNHDLKKSQIFSSNFGDFFEEFVT